MFILLHVSAWLSGIYVNECFIWFILCMLCTLCTSWTVVIQRVYMGSVVKVFKGGEFVGYQARIARVGLPVLTLSFVDYEDACDWLARTEESYIEDPEGVMRGLNRLKELRGRRKKRGKV